MAIHIDIWARIHENQVQREANKLADDLDHAGVVAGDRWTSGYADGVRRGIPKVQKSFNALQTATERARQALVDYQRISVRTDADDEARIRASERLAAARRAEADAHRAASASLRAGISDMQRATGGASRMAESIEKNVAGLTSLGRVGMPVLIGLAGVMYETAQVAVTASQALALIPAAATAAGAAFGTLKLATLGFDQAMKDIRDTKKFSEDLRALSPNAQQAALAIRALIPEFDRLQRTVQDDFFAGFSQKIGELSTTFMPGVQQLTSSIAKSFNQAITSTADTLMTPENQANVATVIDNISNAFKNATPAVASFSQAFIDITTVGSDFLPGLGDSIATVAAEFANFIREARQSGQLQEFIQEGIDAARELGGAIMDIGQFIYEVFGGSGKAEMQAWRNQINNTLDALYPLLEALNLGFKLFNQNVADSEVSLGKLMNPLTSIRDIVNSIRWFFDPNYRAQESALSKATEKLNTERAKRGLGPVDDQGNPLAINGNSPSPGIGSGSRVPGPRAPGQGLQWSDYFGWYVSGPGMLVPGDKQDLPLPGAGQGVGASFNPTNDWSAPRGRGNLGVGGASGSSGGKLSDSERRDAIIAGLDPSLYKVDPYAGLPEQAKWPPGLMQQQGAIPYGVDPQDILEAQHSLLSQAHDLEESKKRRLALERDNTATASEIEEAKWKETEDGWALQKAQAALIEKMRGTNRDLKKGMDDIGVALDPDFGLGKGLAGFAENLTRFVGNLALAPMMTQLNQMKNQAEAEGQPQGGFGLLGILGAKNIMEGKSPLLGRPLSPDQQAAYGATGFTGASSSAVSLPGADVMPSILQDTGRTPSGPQSRQAAALIQQLWGNQIRGKIGGSRDTNTAPGTHDTGTSIDIPIGPDQKALGDEIRSYLMANAEQLGLKYTIWRDLGQNVGGGTFNQPGHQDHIDAHFNGTGGIPGALTAPGSAYGGYSTLGGGTIPIPLPVTIVGAGMGGNGSLPALFGGGSGSGAQPAGPGAEGWRSQVAATVAKYGPMVGIPAAMNQAWTDAIVKQIDIESKGDPNADNPNDSNGRGGTQHVSGLLQYLPSTYAGSGGKLTGLPMNDPIGQIAGALMAPRNPDGSPSSLGKGGGWGPNLNTSINVPRGGQGFPLPLTPANPFGPQPGPGLPNVSGTVMVPGAATSEPNSGSGIQSPIGPSQIYGGGTPITSSSPFGAPDFGMGTPAPGQVGPIPAPPGVAATQGGLGTSALTPLLPAGGNATPGGWAAPPGSAPGAGATTTYGGNYGTPGVAGGGGIGITPGGTVDTLINTAAAAVPGLGQAAATGMKLANRAIQYGGQLAGIGVQGLMETFLPTGGSDLANNSWLTRLAGAAAGAIPALPNIAGGGGGTGGKDAQGPLTPEQAAQYAQSVGGNAQQGNQINVQYDAHGQTEDQNGKALAWHLSQAALPAGVP